jgi:hypothetical protein
VGVLTVEDAIVQLVAESFASVQAIEAEPWRVMPDVSPSYLWTAISRAILSCPSRQAAQDAIRNDPVIGPACADGAPALIGSVGGSGGLLQDSVLPLDLVTAGIVQILALGDVLALDRLAEVVRQNVCDLRAGIAGDNFTGYVLLNFAGIGLAEGSALPTPWGKLVPAGRLLADFWSTRGRVDAQTTAVLAVPVPMTLVEMRVGEPFTSTFSDGYRIGQRVSYGVVLGSTAIDPMAAVPLAERVLMPHGSPGWGGELRFVGLGLRSTALSDQEILDCSSWMHELEKSNLGAVDVGLRRLVRAVAERFDPTDGLIDAVIAWENLVEDRQHPTASVLHGIHALVSAKDWSKSRINDVYDVRSMILHGEPIDRGRVSARQPDAIAIGIEAMRSLFQNHADKVDMSSAERVAKLGFAREPRSG